MIIVGVAYRGASNADLSERGWATSADLRTAVLDFDPTRPVGPVRLDIDTDGTVTARIEAGPLCTPRDCRRWGIFGTRPTLALGFHDPEPGQPLMITTISLVRDNNDPKMPPWTVQAAEREAGPAPDPVL